MFRAKIEHLLRFLNAANDTSQECLDLSAGDGGNARLSCDSNSIEMDLFCVVMMFGRRNISAKLFMRVNRADA